VKDERTYLLHAIAAIDAIQRDDERQPIRLRSHRGQPIGKDG
jgi:hypothetical protein